MADAPKTSRRDFLRGRAAREVLAKLPTGAGEQRGENTPQAAALALPETEAAGYLTTFTRRAMACDFAVLLNAGQYNVGTEAAMAGLDLVEQLETQLTVFRESSEVSQLNRMASAGPVEVEPRLFGLLKIAKQIYLDTEGAYDIATGPLTKLWGFYRRQGQMPDAAELARVMQHVGMRHVILDEERQTVTYSMPDVEINLGSIGKGYALDRVGELLAGEGIRHYLLHGGNSSVLGRGRTLVADEQSDAVANSALSTAVTYSERAADGWWIGLRHPLEPERRIGEVRLHDRALGTSGSGTQFFIHDGRRYGHILDPRSGWPAEGMLSTTVAAESGAEADALATAFYVMGVEKSLEYCRKRAGLSAVLMSPGSEAGTVEIALWGWPEQDIRLNADDSLRVRRVTA